MVAVITNEKKDAVALEFVVEIMNPRQNQQVRNTIILRGGKIADYINEHKLPQMVISDHPLTEKLQSMSDAQKDKMAQRLPLLLKDAVQNKVKIMFSDTFLKKMADKRLNLSQIRPPHLAQKRPHPQGNDSVSDSQRSDFILRIEDESREYQPMLKQINELPKLHFGRDFGISLFHKADDSLMEKRMEELQKEQDGDFDYIDVDSQGGGAIKARERLGGHCEICRKHTSNLKEHYRSKEHQKSINRPGFYDELEQYMGSYVPFIECLGRPLLLRRSRTPSPLSHSFRYGDTDFGKLDDDS